MDAHDISGAEPAVLRNGANVLIRRIRPDDWTELVTLVSRLSLRSRRLRFFTPKGRVSTPFAQHLANVDFVDRAAFVVQFPGEAEVRAVGRYERDGPGAKNAEVAFVVEDRLQGLGIASHLLVHLRLLALENGIETFSATTLGENDDMISVFRNSGMPVTFRHDRELVEVMMILEMPGS